MCRKSRFWSLCAKFILATAKTCSSLVFISKKSCGKIFWDLFYRHRRILFQPHFFPPRKLVNSRRTGVLKNEVGLGIIIFPPPSNEKKMPCKLVTKKIIFLRKGKCFPIKVMDEEISDKKKCQVSFAFSDATKEMQPPSLSHKTREIKCSLWIFYPAW